MAIPAFDSGGSLPPGEHEATWEEVVTRFRFSTRRRELLRGLLQALLELKRKGCQTVYLDGSFVTSKRNPGDFDCAWDPRGVDPSLDPTFFDFANERESQKTKWGGEFLPSTMRETRSGVTFREYFRKVHDPPEKGIVVLQLRSLP